MTTATPTPTALPTPTPAPVAPASAIEIRYLDPASVSCPDLLQTMHGWLDPTEQDRFKRFVRPADQHQFLVSHALLRCVLGQRLGCAPRKVRFSYTERNKPVIDLRGGQALGQPLDEPPLHFNLSHTQNMAVVALAQAPVGVDTEWLGRCAPAHDLAARYFTPAECRDIQNRSPEQSQRHFLGYWTLKEAFLKAEGWGIVDRLDSFEFELSPHTAWPPARIRLRVRQALSLPTRPWRFYQWHIEPDHLVSLAACARQTQHQTPDIRCWQAHEWLR